MTVPTSHIALGNLVDDDLPGLGDGKPRHFGPLRRTVPVVELEHKRVGLAAIDARMRLQVFEGPDAVVDPRSM